MVHIQSLSPAYNRKAVEGDNTLVELDWIGKINLRGEVENKSFTKAVATVLGVDLPYQAHGYEQANGRTVYWLGPNEWLVYCEIGETLALVNALQGSLQGVHSAVVDVSDYYTVLQLEGPDTSSLLAKGCPLDLHPLVFPKGHCTQTRFGHASILLHKISNTPRYNIQVRWSFTEYVWDYLLSTLKALD